MTSMSLDAWIAELSGRHSTEINLGLSRVQAVVQQLNINFNNATVITIAGTNGKGSCVATLEALAVASGKRVATLTSPHFYQFNERIRIDGQAVSDQTIVDAFEQVDRVAIDFNPTFFEMNVLAALHIFNQEPLDVVLLEVGLGGRLDAVNVIDPNVAVITSIGLDHTDWLGDTIEKIGAEKAGILREGIDVFLASADMPRSVIDRADLLECNVAQYTNQFDGNDGVSWRVGNNSFSTVSVNLPAPSVAAALAVADSLDWFESTNAMIEQFKQVATSLQLTGRFERRILAGRRWIFDVAHNQPAARFLVSQTQLQGMSFDTIVFAVMSDKDVELIVNELKSLQAKWVLLHLDDNDRALSPDALKVKLLEAGVGSDWISVMSVRQAKRAIMTGELGQGLVCGSFFTVAALDLQEE